MCELKDTECTCHLETDNANSVQADMFVVRQKLLNLLWDEGCINHKEIKQKQKPTHGICCTCRDCGWGHDECICSSNEIIGKIYKLFTV